MHVVCQLPMITDLRNPNLRARHWDKIEQVLKYKFTEEDPMTLGKLEEMDAFEHNEEIQEVSSQASSEAGLEIILKKVRGFVWRRVIFANFDLANNNWSLVLIWTAADMPNDINLITYLI